MRKVILCFWAVAACLSLPAVAPSTELRAPDFAATWQGTLPDGAEQHRVVLQIAKKDLGGWTPTGCYVEFTHDEMHVDSMVVDGAELRLTMNGAKATYEGKISADGASISGTWTFDGHALPLNLHRTAAGSA